MVVVCPRISQACVGGRLRPVAAFRLLNVPLRVALVSGPCEE